MQDTDGGKKKYTYVLRLTDRKKEEIKETHTITKITNKKNFDNRMFFFFF